LSQHSIKAPQFEARFLLPHFWHVWLGAGVLYLVTWLPYRVILVLGKGFGRLLGVLAPKRVAIARRNIALTFPEWSPQEVDRVFQMNIDRTGMALFETAMGWWWPDWRVKKHITFQGFEHIDNILATGKGVFGLALHNVNLEFACRAIGYSHPSIAFYRKHNNALMAYFQYHGRNRANKYMIHKRNAKALIEALNEGEIGLYLPDQDYGAAQSIFVPFGGVEQTATTTGTLMFAERANCEPVLISSQYTKSGYTIKCYPVNNYLVDKDKERALTRLNQDLLTLIKEQPESYLWMHKRFKTRPESAPQSLYE
jgi:KDO2-lipid IV(A) lauroyltransferase